MFLYELSVAEAYRRRGIGRSLVEALAALPGSGAVTGCGSAWTRTTRPRSRRIAARAAGTAVGAPSSSGRSSERRPGRG
ncbi:GNAT family N-acetyltransferase [Streptomyces sp. NPDC000188]|uniref:GNAT family N-acetyltransferase n=1 Tax=unclassified Streptomyces TaxID=2593676 RepID=UPI003331974F